MTQSQLLKAYKKNNWITTNRKYSGCYICTLGNNVYRVEAQDSKEWIVTTISGPAHDYTDTYITHSDSLTEAQVYLVNIQ